MAISHLFLYMEPTPVVVSIYMCSLLHVLCAALSLCYVRDKVCVMCGLFICVMCGLQSVLCAGCTHDPRRFAPSMPRFAR